MLSYNSEVTTHALGVLSSYFPLKGTKKSFHKSLYFFVIIKPDFVSKLTKSIEGKEIPSFINYQSSISPFLQPNHLSCAGP